MYLVQNPLQSRRPGYREEAVDLEMDGQRYRAVKHVVTAPDSDGVEPVYIPAANGFYEDPHIWRPLARRLATIAQKAGQQMTIVTYEDSSPSGIQDTLSFRAERLAHVIRATRSDGRMVMGAHSRGWISTVLAAEASRDDITGLVGFGVAGLAPRDAADISVKKIHEISSGQVASVIAAHTGPADAWDKIVVGQRFIHNSLSYYTSNRQEMYREGSQVLTADVIARTVELSERFPTTLWVHEHDAYFDATTVHGNLATAGFQGKTRDVPTSHLGPLMDYSLALSLYQDLVGTGLED